MNEPSGGQEEEELIILCQAVTANNAAIIAAAPNMTPKQLADTMNDMQAAMYCSTNAMQSAGIS